MNKKFYLTISVRVFLSRTPLPSTSIKFSRNATSTVIPGNGWQSKCCRDKRKVAKRLGRQNAICTQNKRAQLHSKRKTLVGVARVIMTSDKLVAIMYKRRIYSTAGIHKRLFHFSGLNVSTLLTWRVCMCERPIYTDQDNLFYREMDLIFPSFAVIHNDIKFVNFNGFQSVTLFF